MRFVLCDDDQLFTSMIEAMLNDLGHAVVGVGISTADSVALVETARPDVVIVDLSLGFNTDFDIIASGEAIGAKTIIFSQNADDAIIRQYAVRPAVVFKPDLGELERVVTRLGLDTDQRVVSHDRRQHPTRPAAGPTPTSSADAQAFYEALNASTAGDVLLVIQPTNGKEVEDVDDAANRVRAVLRDGDRFLASSTAVRVLLPGAEEVGAISFTERVHAADAMPAGASVRWVIVAPGELPVDAFDRLKASAENPY